MGVWMSDIRGPMSEVRGRMSDHGLRTTVFSCYFVGRKKGGPNMSKTMEYIGEMLPDGEHYPFVNTVAILNHSMFKTFPAQEV